MLLFKPAVYLHQPMQSEIAQTLILMCENNMHHFKALALFSADVICIVRQGRCTVSMQLQYIGLCFMIRYHIDRCINDS